MNYLRTAAQGRTIMLERETELIKQIIVESTIGAREAVKLNEVTATDLPRGVKSFITAEVVKHLEADFRQTSLSRISKGVAFTVTAERSVLRAFAMEYTLQRAEYLKLVEDTVHFLENYLCRPQWTLRQLMFEHAKTISFDEMATKLELAVEYSYFRILIERHARRAGMKEISDEQFTPLVERIDDEIVKKHSPRELALLTRPIYDFLLFGDVSMDRPVPLGAILLFFEDKKLKQVKEYIDRMYQLRPRRQISMNELITMIEDLYNVKTAVTQDVQEAEKEILTPREKAEEPQPAVAAAEAVEQPAPPPQAETKPVIETEPEPERVIGIDQIDVLSTQRDEQTTTKALDDMPQAVDAIFFDATLETADIDITQLDHADLEEDIPPIETHTPTVVNPSVLAEFAKERERLRQAIWSFPERSEPTETRADLLDVDDSFSAELREKFIRRVFNGNETEYAIFMNSVNKAHTWREAQVHLRQLFEINKFDLRSPDIVEFTDAMHARFNPDLKNA